MKTVSTRHLLVVAVALAAVAAGCITRSAARAQANEAFLAGQRSEARTEEQKAQPMVTVRGDVQHSQIPWTEELTLARAIVAAGLNGLINPTAFEVIRKGEASRIDARRLLRGEDFSLEAGDVIEIRQ